MITLVLLALFGFALGAAVRRWYVLLMPVGVPVYSLSREWGWWGHGTGEMWELATFIATVVTACAVIAGVMLGRLLIARRLRRS